MQDLHRPTYHFMPPAHWMNDPNGPLFYRGHYHLFYQHNPAGDRWGTIHWGHAVSCDLLRWTHWPLALAPDPAAQELHCYSGCAVLDGDTPALLYTSVGEGARDARTGSDQRVAFSHDGMRSFVRHPEPALTQALHDRPVTEWRDPFAWREADGWYLVVGGSRDGHGVVLRYRSDDLIRWECLGILHEDPSVPSCECPNLLTFGGRKLLLYSPYGQAVYHTGVIGPDGRLAVERSGVIDHSGPLGYYAPTTLINHPSGDLIQWGWITENARGGFPIEGYNGALSLPRKLWLDADGTLRQRPAEAMEALRQAPETHAGLRLNGAFDLKTRGRAYVLLLKADLSEEDDFTVELLATPDGQERTLVRIDWPNRHVSLIKEHVSLDERPNRQTQTAPLREGDRKLELAVYVDHSILEIFVNDREAVTGRVYPTRGDAEGIRLTGSAGVLSATVHSMAPLTYDMLDD
ncbi:MAG TPA: glycoside hydrolase family 32 protein [Clostridia bacterium]|nr:glycoside hydrolase family 32 protein [Clostridia bacterium]